MAHKFVTEATENAEMLDLFSKHTNLHINRREIAMEITTVERDIKVKLLDYGRVECLSVNWSNFRKVYQS